MMKGLTYDAGAAAYDRFTGRWSLAFAAGLISAAGVTAGRTVLEVAAGTGGWLTALTVSALTPSGRVIATAECLPTRSAGGTSRTSGMFSIRRRPSWIPIVSNSYSPPRASGMFPS